MMCERCDSNACLRHGCFGAPPLREEWRSVELHPNYIVSNLGRVRHRRVNAPILAGDTDPKGYRRVKLDGRHQRVARLVCAAFHGPCPEGYECGHLDGDAQNNRADNLAWITRSENTRHSIQHGTYVRPTPPRGETHPHAKLTNKQVAEIREKAAAGASQRAIAREYGISASHAHRLITKEDRADV